MPEALNPIVQRMIDSGESEENIATVIRHYKQAGPSVVSADEPGTFVGGAAQSIRDTIAKTGRGIVEGLNPLPVLKSIWDNGTDNLPYQPNDTPATAMARIKTHDAPGPSAMDTVKGLSDPETGGRAIGNLTQALITGRLVSAAANPKARVLAGQGLNMVGDIDFRHPLKSTVGKAADALIRSGTPEPTPAPAPAGPHMDLSQPIRPGTLTQQQIGERIAAARAAGGMSVQPPPQKPILGGRLQMAPVEAPAAAPAPPAVSAPPLTAPPPTAAPAPSAAIRIGPDGLLVGRPGGNPSMPNQASLNDAALASRRQAYQQRAESSMPPPAAAPPPAAPEAVTLARRVQAGAEVVGRQAGLSKEAVRQQTGPILGEAAGDASPILPSGALNKIIDTLKAMPPGSAEREAYVARATSGKAQWQIENIRRTLEHLGLIVPVAAAVPNVRDAVMARLRGEQPQ